VHSDGSHVAAKTILCRPSGMNFAQPNAYSGICVVFPRSTAFWDSHGCRPENCNKHAENLGVRQCVSDSCF
jgi:hypothetical protein